MVYRKEKGSSISHRLSLCTMEEPESKSWDTYENTVQKLDSDTIIYVLNFLDTPTDLVHAACVSRLWHHYVSEGGLWRQMCIKCFPEIAKFKCIVDSGRQECSSSALGASQWTSLQSSEESRLYNQLLCELQGRPSEKSCIREPLNASSTDNFPTESIAQTLFPRPMYSDGQTPSYWSSGGQVNPDVPETLTYGLVSDLCVVHEVKIRPFLAYFQPDDPIYSAKSVVFRFGYSRSPRLRWSGLLDCISEAPKKVNNDDYVWTYESPAFPMAQEDTLQTFKLPRPVLCMGGIFQIEFMGRVQTQLTDGLYYICVAYVSVCGTTVSNFKFEALDRHDQYLLKYLSWKREILSTPRNHSSSSSEENTAGSPGWFSLPERIKQIRTKRMSRNRWLPWP